MSLRRWHFASGLLGHDNRFWFFLENYIIIGLGVGDDDEGYE